MKQILFIATALLFAFAEFHCKAQTSTTTTLPALAASQESWATISNKWSAIPVPQLIKSAEGGDLSAQYYLGDCYLNGLKVGKDEKESFKWMKLAGDQGMTIAQRRLGWMFRNGSGVDKDIQASIDWYRKAAELGDSLAQLDYGWHFIEGPYDQRDYTSAEKWLRKAAESDLPETQYWMGKFMIEQFDKSGKNVPNYPVAGEWYTKAAEQGHVEAQFQLAEMYNYGQLGNDKRSNCIPWYIKAAASGHTKAQGELAELPESYPNSELLKSLNSVTFLRQSAEKDNLTAQIELSDRYKIGYGVPKDPVQAFKWMEKAAAQQNSLELTLRANTKGFLGQFYDTGTGVTQDFSKARQLYEAAIAAGYMNQIGVYYRLGKMYEKGEGGPQSDSQAAELYAAAFEQFGPLQFDTFRVVEKEGDTNSPMHLSTSNNFTGSLAAESLFKLYLQGRGLPDDKTEVLTQFNAMKDRVKTPTWQFLVGEMYYQGKFIKQDNAQAAELFNKAAQAGSADAMNRIGEMWAAGLNGQADPKEAANWYRKAASKGLAAAQLNLGRALRKGDGVTQDDVEASAWLQLASNQDMKEAREESKQLDAKLTPEQREAATRRADSLKATAPPNTH